MIAQGSLRFILPPFLLGILVSYFNIFLGLIFIFFAVYMIWFFRDPKREININPNVIFAAADGTLLYQNEEDGIYKIAIRMSPFNVHINRSPISGKVTVIEYTPGAHRNVYFGDIETKNERNLIIIENEDMVLEILQITGSFARRIECWVNSGQTIIQGDKIGMIRFGSQTNMAIRLKNKDKFIDVAVNTGETIKAGLTVIAHIKSGEN